MLIAGKNLGTLLSVGLQALIARFLGPADG